MEVTATAADTTMSPLEMLALESSSERRRELLRGLTDMFLDGVEQQTKRSSELFSDIVCRVLDEVVEEARADLSQRVGPMVNFPKDVIHKLANDVISVASPVLENSPVLDDAELVKIAKGHSQEHLLAISRRRELREAVTDVLVERGEDAVLHALTENAGARFSEQGFDTLADKAMSDVTLQENLASRPDITSSAARKLDTVLKDELRQRLNFARALNMDKDFESYVSKAKSRLENALKGSRRERIEMQVLINEVSHGVQTLSAAITRLAKENRPVHVGWLIAAIAELPEAIVSNAMGKTNGLPIAVTCKALGVSNDAFHALALMRSRRLNQPAQTADKLSEQYRGLHLAESQRTLRFLKVRHSTAANRSAV